MTGTHMAMLMEDLVETVQRTFEDGVREVIRAEADRVPSWERHKVDVPEGASGDWAVERFSVTPEEESFEKMRCAFNPQRVARFAPVGDYTRLVRGNGVVMSDTPDEIMDHMEPMRRARGRCLVNGLGLGMVAEGMLRRPDVERVTVVELSEDVIALVGPHYRARHGDRLEIVHGDAFEWVPPRGVRYDVVWHDIFDDISADNLPLMTRLKRRYCRRCDWQGCWAEDQCRNQKKRMKSGRVSSRKGLY